MDLDNLKKEYVKNELDIREDFGHIFSFIDFANVNNWFTEDNQDWDNQAIDIDEKIEIDIEKLKEFSDIFSDRTRLYYGENPTNIGSINFTYALRKVFGKRDVITKDLQKIKHYIGIYEPEKNPKYLEIDKSGKSFVEIRKCNFDVEIAVDAYRMIEHYDTFCIFSGDADFVYLNNFLKKKGKKIIIIKGGFITSKLRESSDLIINAQKIKKHIARVVKQKPD